MPATHSQVQALLLGAAQDGGVPHMACNCTNCAAAKSGAAPQQAAVSLALVDRQARAAFLIDCSPDIKLQYDLLRAFAPECELQGVILTHLHMGHYIGLFQFGKEAAERPGLRLWGTDSVGAFFRSNLPWSDMLQRGTLQLAPPLQPGSWLQLTPSLAVQPVAVPHRQEYSDCVAFYVRGPSSQLFYSPDIDSWSAWSTPLRQVVEQVDLALVDACFFSHEEISAKGRDPSQIPHPLVPVTAELVQGLEHRVVLIHLNHTNPLWAPASEASRWAAARGLRVGRQGEAWAL